MARQMILAWALLLGTPVIYGSDKVSPEKGAADYIKTDCNGTVTKAESTHKSCRIEATYGWVMYPATRLLTIPPGGTQTFMSTAGCADLKGARFLDPNCS
jgi:hypothetical protein